MGPRLCTRAGPCCRLQAMALRRALRLWALPPGDHFHRVEGRERDRSIARPRSLAQEKNRLSRFRSVASAARIGSFFEARPATAFTTGSVTFRSRACRTAASVSIRDLSSAAFRLARLSSTPSSRSLFPVRWSPAKEPAALRRPVAPARSWSPRARAASVPLPAFGTSSRVCRVPASAVGRPAVAILEIEAWIGSRAALVDRSHCAVDLPGREHLACNPSRLGHYDGNVSDWPDPKTV